MAEPVSIQTMLTYLTLISVPVGVFYHIMTLRNQSRTRQVQLFMQIYNRWTDPIFQENFLEVTNRDWKDFDDYNKKYGTIHEEAKRRTIGQYFEGIGVLVYRNFIDVSLVDDMMSSFVFGFWEKYESIIKNNRERLNTPQILEWAEYLYIEVRKVAERQHPELKN
jgi:hypothetical protein